MSISVEEFKKMQKSNWVRGKQLEDAVADLLDLGNISYQRVDNYRCHDCGAIGNVNSKGWPDFFAFHPFLLAIECKSGKAGLSKAQKEVRRKLQAAGVKYIVVKRTTDTLLHFLKQKGYINL